jgi:glutaminase
VNRSKRQPLVRALVVALLPAACATPGGPAGGAGSGSVSVTPPPEEPPAFLLAAARAAPAAQPAPRPAPAGDPFRNALAETYRSLKGLDEGKNADHSPVLARVDARLFGLALVTVQGAVYEIGSARHEFSIQSVSSPFTAARAIESAGAETVHQRIGVNATGQRPNSLLAIDLLKNAPADKEHVVPAGNPLVTAGAIATVDLLPAAMGLDKWGTILANLEAFAGRSLNLNENVYRAETETNSRDQAIAQLLKDYEVIRGDPNQALDLYTRACSVSVSARDLAVMGATLANGGKNPLTGVQVVAPGTAGRVVAVVTTAGLYEATGAWLYKVGVPAKGGVGGGIVAVVPGRFAVGTFSPPLDPAGNSVRGQRAIELIMQKLNANLFASRPAAPVQPTGAFNSTPAPAQAPAPPVARGN